MTDFCGERSPMIGLLSSMLCCSQCITHSKDKMLKVFHHYTAIFPLEAELYTGAGLQTRTTSEDGEPGGSLSQTQLQQSLNLDISLTQRET